MVVMEVVVMVVMVEDPRLPEPVVGKKLSSRAVGTLSKKGSLTILMIFALIAF